MDMGIVNPAQLQVYDDIDKTLLVLVEDVLLNRRDDAPERLVEHAESLKGITRNGSLYCLLFIYILSVVINLLTL